MKSYTQEKYYGKFTKEKILKSLQILLLSCKYAILAL